MAILESLFFFGVVIYALNSIVEFDRYVPKSIEAALSLSVMQWVFAALILFGILRAILSGRFVDATRAFIQDHWHLLFYLVWVFGTIVIWAFASDFIKFRFDQQGVGFDLSRIRLLRLNYAATLGLAISLAGVTISAIYIGARYSFRQTQSMLVFLIATLAIGSIFVIIFAPETGIHQSYKVEGVANIEGAWRGLLPHKNRLGALMVLGNILFLVRLSSFRMDEKIIRWANLAFFGLTLVLSIFSRSATAWLVLAVVYGLVFLAWLIYRMRLRLQPRHWIAFSAFAAALVVLVWFLRDKIFPLVGRSETFSGRMNLWRYLFENFGFQHIWSGYGFGVFWNTYHDAVSAMLKSWMPDNAHSGYFDIILNTGLIGFALFMIFLAFAIVRSIRLAVKLQTAFALTPLLLIVAIALLATMESILATNRILIYWFVLVLAYSSSTAALAKAQRQEDV
jgi:O-antigen ligase